MSRYVREDLRSWQALEIMGDLIVLLAKQSIYFFPNGEDAPKIKELYDKLKKDNG